MKQKYNSNDLKTYFLPYQIEWLNNKSKIKIWEKSRRIGATYVQSFEDVLDCIEGRVPKVWFSSADLTAAKEYIDYCSHWVKIFNVVAENLDETVIDEKRGIKAYTLKFENGAEIHALSSNPKNFRSKGGKVILDEFAFHEQPKKMWKAAFPVTTWGYPLVILSTHNGKNSMFNKFIEDIKAGKKKWFHYKIDIYEAVKQGLADKIIGKQLTKKERRKWIKELKDLCDDPETWSQEYECNPEDEATAFLTYDMIYSVEQKAILNEKLLNITGDLYCGVDIARKKNFFVIWILEKLGSQKITRKTIELRNTKFRILRENLYSILKHPKLRRCCIDETGLGMQLAEEAQDEFGKYKVEKITFTSKAKEELAFTLYNSIEDQNTIIPAGNIVLRDDLHSVKKIVTTSGNIRFDAVNSQKIGHADRFWSLALANFAATDYKGPPIARSRRKRAAYELTRGYED